MFKGTSKLVFLALALSWIPIACTANTDPEATTPVLQQLRITNNGDTDIVGLVVLFPGSAWDAEASRVEFGNIPAEKPLSTKIFPAESIDMPLMNIFWTVKR